MSAKSVIAAASGPPGEVVSDGLFWLRIARGTAAGTADLVKGLAVEARFTYGVLKTKATTAVQHYRAERQWSMDDQPDKTEVPWKAKTKPWKRATATTYLCLPCSRKWTSAAALNDHQERVHGQETPAWQDEHARASRKVRRGKTTAKQKVRGARPATRPTATEPTTTNGARKMTTTATESEGVTRLRAAWASFGESRPGKLSEIRADMLGLEQVMGAVAAEAIALYRRRLVMMGFDSALLMNLNGMESTAEEMARRASATIATIEEVLAKDIAAAKSRKGGSKPDDAVLAG